MGSLKPPTSDPNVDCGIYPNRPGVYLMQNQQGDILYVGKALDLRKRIRQYFRKDLPIKTRIFMQEVHHIDYVITGSEREALLLEATLIKQHRPKYNVLLKDDKSYPYLLLNRTSPFPKFELHRGAKKKKGDYFGPYSHAQGVRLAMDWLQKVFLLRSCSDQMFAHRKRPCLQYQMKRCTAPCVQYISEENYQKSVDQAVLFLEGKNQTLLKQLQQDMHQAAEAMQFEKAAALRDQMARLTTLQEKQFVVQTQGDLDVIAWVTTDRVPGRGVFSRLVVRGGLVLGHRIYGIKQDDHVEDEGVGTQWLAQCYGEKESWPDLILVSREEVIWKPEDFVAFREAWSTPDHRVSIRYVRGEKEKQLYAMARENAKDALNKQLQKWARYGMAGEQLQKNLGLSQLPREVVCFDVSHFQGEATVVSLVVFNLEGAVKRAYRRYHVEPEHKGDDYEALRLAFERYAQSVQEGRRAFPDVILVDGGLGQYGVIQSILEAFQANVPLLAIAKGPLRKSGQERLFYGRAGDKPCEIQLAEQAFLWVQAIRDEAHRFAVGGHRRRRDRARQK